MTGGTEKGRERVFGLHKMERDMHIARTFHGIGPLMRLRRLFFRTPYFQTEPRCPGTGWVITRDFLLVKWTSGEYGTEYMYLMSPLSGADSCVSSGHSFLLPTWSQDQKNQRTSVLPRHAHTRSCLIHPHKNVGGMLGGVV